MMEKYEIWTGYYHLGQGFDPPVRPQKVAEIEATSFPVACYIYELKRALNSLISRMSNGDTYIEDCHFGKLYYDGKTNSNSWTGTYFETEEEALKTFKK